MDASNFVIIYGLVFTFEVMTLKTNRLVARIYQIFALRFG